jgi:hypothetical protein
MKNLAILSALVGATMLSTVVAAQEAPEGDYVCLITFATAEQAQNGADADALSAEYVPLEEAIQQTAENELLAYWDYTDDGYDTNAEEQEFCLTTFNPDDGDDGEANPNSAKKYAPGQVKGDGESAKDVAPGQIKGEGETGKDNAPGQEKKND